ncbi:hypothetical protein BaRGS_00026764 [Batillaria attramentaria]|uniref:Tyr recombinase domain-containing protein n=1 Tax=Batillaria attramentaria TaxID=370345 RepID=A0ABD0K4U8_9CAEN
MVPPDWEMLSRYVAFLARSKRPSTIRQYLNIIRILHLQADLPNPCLDNFKLDSLLAGIRRVRGTAQAYKLPVSPNHLLNLRRHLDMNNMCDCQLWAAILVGFGGLLRVSNFTDSDKCARRQDVHMVEGGLRIFIHSSKTIQFQQRHHVVHLPVLKDQPLCPVSALVTFLSRSMAVPDGAPLFSMVRGGRVVPLSSEASRRRLATLFSACGLPCDQYNTHNLRRGGATWLICAGVPLEVVKKLGDWKSDSIIRHITPDSGQILQTLSSVKLQ